MASGLRGRPGPRFGFTVYLLRVAMNLYTWIRGESDMIRRGAGRSTDCPPRCHRARLAGADLFRGGGGGESMVETNDTTRPGKRGERSREEYVGRSLQLPQDQPPIDWSSPLGVGQRLRRIVDRHLEEKGQTEPGRKKLPVGLWKEITPLLPEEVRHAKPDTLRQGYNRAWDYLPSDYNQRVSAFQT